MKLNVTRSEMRRILELERACYQDGSHWDDLFLAGLRKILGRVVKQDWRPGDLEFDVRPDGWDGRVP